jgi:hypothetical protein
VAEAAHLIDVDLHVESRRSLAALHAALPTAQPRDVDNARWVHLTAYTSRRAKTADRMVMELVALIDSLPRAARRCWNEARVRTFDLAIQAGPEIDGAKGFRAFDDVVLAPETLRAVSRVKARIQVTVYPPQGATTDASVNAERPRFSGIK